MHALRILYIEPPSRVRDTLAAALTRRRCEVEVVSSPRDVRGELRQVPFDAIVLDYDSGHSVGWLSRRRGDGVPSVVLCGLGDVRHIRAGYGAGATLCLPRPIDAPSLLAHIEAMLVRSGRRAQEPQPEHATLDCKRSVLEFPDGTTVDLLGQDVQVLMVLAGAGGPVTGSDLIKALWPAAAPSDSANRLRLIVWRLRRRLGRFAYILRSVWGSGYLLAIELEVRGESKAQERSPASKRAARR